MSQPFSIVEANTEHVDALAQLFDAYRVFYQQPSDPAAAKTFVHDRLANSQSVVFLALGGPDGRGTPLGFTQLYPSFSSVSMRRLWILNDLYVAPDGRRRGVARALIDRARKLAVDTNAKGIILETTIDNLPAQALYDACGFTKITEFYRYFLDV